MTSQRTSRNLARRIAVRVLACAGAVLAVIAVAGQAGIPASAATTSEDRVSAWPPYIVEAETTALELRVGESFAVISVPKRGSTVRITDPRLLRVITTRKDPVPRVLAVAAGSTLVTVSDGAGHRQRFRVTVAR